MRISISTDGEFVSEHFGRCTSYTIIDIENGKIAKREVVNNPGHMPGAIPHFLHERGVECVIAGGMGPRAIALFSELGIKTVVGVSGKIEEVIEQIQQGTLKGGESLCRTGSGKGSRIDKVQCDHDNISSKW